MLYLQNKLSELTSDKEVKKALQAAYPYAFAEEPTPIELRYATGMEMNVTTDKGNVIPQRTKEVLVLTKLDQVVNLTSKDRELVSVAYTEESAKIEEKTGKLKVTARHKNIAYGHFLYPKQGGKDYEFLIFLHFFSPQFEGGHPDKQLSESYQRIVAFNEEISAQQELDEMAEINNVKGAVLKASEEQLRTLAQVLPNINHEAAKVVLQKTIANLIDKDADARKRIKEFVASFSEEVKESVQEVTRIKKAITEGHIQADERGVFCILKGDREELIPGPQNLEDKQTIEKIVAIYKSSSAPLQKAMIGAK
jgi:hypothetical protein